MSPWDFLSYSVPHSTRLAWDCGAMTNACLTASTGFLEVDPKVSTEDDGVRRTKMVRTPSLASIIYGSVRMKTPRYTDTLFCASWNCPSSTSSFHRPWCGDSFKSSSLTYFQRTALTASHDHGSWSCRCRYSLLARDPESIIAAAPKAKPIAASHFRGISSDCSGHKDPEFTCIPIRWTNGLLPTLGDR